MNEENFEYLSNQVKYSGFGDGLKNALKEEMEGKKPAFTLEHKPDFDNSDFKATLHFRRSAESGMVFFNKYEAELKQKDDTIKQTFFMGHENNFTLKEAFNLMNGRAVHKELEKLEKVGEGENARYQGTGEKYKTWAILDFKETEKNGNFKTKYYHENYGFDLEDTLSKLKIKDLDDPEAKESLIKSLEKGNRQAVTFLQDGEEKKGFIQANPRFFSIKQFDEKNIEIKPAKKQSETKSQSQKTSQSAKTKKTAGEDGSPAANKPKRKSKKVA